MNNKEFPLFELWDKLGNKTNSEVKMVIFHCDRCVELVLETTVLLCISSIQMIKQNRAHSK